MMNSSTLASLEVEVEPAVTANDDELMIDTDPTVLSLDPSSTSSGLAFPPVAPGAEKNNTQIRNKTDTNTTPPHDSSEKRLAEYFRPTD